MAWDVLQNSPKYRAGLVDWSTASRKRDADFPSLDIVVLPNSPRHFL
jgi:hypothetical protein